ncbi:hypothetical protein BU24DRAFT_128329 [Aaosphaeria arxii CBS 175.79]|uniref:DUF6594 domain-containing protein n=1 Tax=Aaosphaeria arxii CBS 175.79 TaxID=1450172 RepID=A0A6A5Y2U2_9PLEO|nr:uncharacterized protein BU24DRAFT_128329 [Aaosphaeria arxii CBS 175.79]KAF2019875.1 hypothetical protein BU24DRAFT_128329 [Aaosphaeria arxii CBS 175.79]
MNLPPPVTSGIAAPFIASFPIELQNIPKPPDTSIYPTPDATAKRKKAWKYEGYQEFSKWMASDDDFFVIRRFQSLNAHVILYMQNRIVKIEERLEQIHANNENTEGQRNNGSFSWDMKNEPERDRLMCELTTVLHHYNQYVETFSKIRDRPRAEDRQIRNLETFLKRKAVAEPERKFANHKADLISINPHPSTPLGKLLERTRLIRLSRMVESKADPSYQSNSGNTHYSSDAALDNLSTGSIIILGLCMLLGPMWWLEFVSNSIIRLTIITVFLACFMGSMALATVNRPFEVVASSAAYAAVLMVFMQIDGNSKQPQ